MTAEEALGVLIVIQIALVGGFIHHLYQCRNVQRTLGRILQKLEMEDDD